MSDFIWPVVFEEGAADYPKTKEGRGRALVDANTGWAICHSGGTPPENFGKGMVAIGGFLGEPATPENISKLSKEFLASD